jgi:hypothetical protein
VVHVAAGDTDANSPLARQYGADLQQGFPYLTILDGAGKVVTHQETGALEAGQQHDAKKVLAFLAQHQAPPQDAQKAYDAALARAKAEGKRLLVAFEAPW